MTLATTNHYDTFTRHKLFARWKFGAYVHIYSDMRKLPYHTHPWHNLSIVLRGNLNEKLARNYASFDTRRPFRPFWHRCVFRKRTTAHTMHIERLPVVTLFFTFGEAINHGP